MQICFSGRILIVRLFSNLYEKQPIVFFSQRDIGLFNDRTFENEHGKKTHLRFEIEVKGYNEFQECYVNLIYCDRTIVANTNHCDYVRM